VREVGLSPLNRHFQDEEDKVTSRRLRVARFVIVGCLSGCILLACGHQVKEVAKPVEQGIAPPATIEPHTPAPADRHQQRAQIEADLLKILDPSRALQAPEAAARPTPETEGTGVGATDDPLVKSTCAKIADKLKSISVGECRRLALSQTGHYSVNGIPILQKIFPPKPGIRPLGRVTVIGGTHGNELSSISLVFKWLGKLQRNHSGLFHWTVVPLLNPDGALRKRVTRVNANGVDLNRNLPTSKWQHQSRVYWIKRTRRNPGRYPGPSPGSEPESQWLIQHLDAFQPDIIISVHALYALVDYDAPDRRAAPQRIGMLDRNFLGIYPGSLGNYAGLHKGIPVITLELPDSWTLPKPNQITHMWADLVRWLRYNVRDAQTQRLVRYGQPGDR